ncbi:MAG: hypothetical protein ACI9SY_000668 [Candidatus Paceibacteria bacterium]|jgi:hypothetical protein
MKTTSNISNKIMRRIYMSYALSYTEQPLLWAGLVLGGAVALLGRFTHVASVIENTLATPLGGIPSYVANSFLSAIARGELGTVLVILTIASMSSVVVWQLSRMRFGIALKAA